jgi:hypothetical protein
VTGTRLKREIVASYREAKILRGECRECKRPVKIKSNGQPARVCAEHAKADVNRRKKPDATA